MHSMDLMFPAWVRITHWFNFLFLSMVARSGLGILADLPKLYWDADARPGSEWLVLTRRKMPRDRLWCSTDEIEHWPSWLALPGGPHFGLSRSLHFIGAVGWLLTGMVYVIAMLTSPQWHRLVPTSPRIFVDAWGVLREYLNFRFTDTAAVSPLQPFNALQQLTYFGIIFLLSPLMILTGLAQSPAIIARFPRFLRLFGNRQVARSLHFLGLVAFVLFFLGHLAMVFAHGLARGMEHIVLGVDGGHAALALGLGGAIVAAVVAVHVGLTFLCHRDPRATQRSLNRILVPLSEATLHPLVSVQSYPESRISAFHRVNGYPPLTVYPQAKGDDDTYERLLAGGFRDYRLQVHGLVRRPLLLSLDELRSMPKRRQVTMHHCVQGWSSVGKWSGVSVARLLELCEPLPQARYLAFTSFGMHEGTGRRFYECIDLKMARAPQTILAYELNDHTLPVQHGAPLRLRVESCLGYKMVKYLKSIELIDDYRRVGGGMGGVREDEQFFEAMSHI